MTHIDHKAHIARYGITSKHSRDKNPHYKAIGDEDLTARRAQIDDSAIAFYFAKRTPMLFCIQRSNRAGVEKHRPADIVYCAVSLSRLFAAKTPFHYTDGHANHRITKKHKDPRSIEEVRQALDWRAIECDRWGADSEIKRKKQAECLVLGDIPPMMLAGFIVYNGVARKRLEDLNLAPVRVNPADYF